MGQTAADQLRQVIVPDLVRLVGDIKVQRVSPSGVTAYLHRQQLIFDEQLLLSMFVEADFKHEGSLGVGPLTGAIQGRYSLLHCCIDTCQCGKPKPKVAPIRPGFRKGGMDRRTGWPLCLSSSRGRYRSCKTC